MHWESQDDYLRLLKKASKDEVFGWIRSDLRESTSKMLNLAVLIKAINNESSVLTREKFDEDEDLLDIVNMLLATVLTECPNIAMVINAASQRYEDEGS